jgi:hypothetical protein
MEITAARSVLGVSAEDDWETVRDAYRALIRTTHPDLVGASGTAGSIRVNAAYRTLALARREGRLNTVDPPAPAARPAPPPPRPPRPPRRPRSSERIAGDVRLVGGDTLVLSSTPAETFRRLVEATNALGEISYIDRSSAIFEAVLELEDGAHASFVVSLQWRAHDATCEAFCTLEALDRAESLDVSGVLEQLAQFIPPDADADPR